MPFALTATRKDQEATGKRAKDKHIWDPHLHQVVLGMVIAEWKPLDTSTPAAPGETVLLKHQAV